MPIVQGPGSSNEEKPKGVIARIIQGRKRTQGVALFLPKNNNNEG
jgi:hypothetical protein